MLRTVKNAQALANFGPNSWALRSSTLAASSAGELLACGDPKNGLSAVAIEALVIYSTWPGIALSERGAKNVCHGRFRQNLNRSGLIKPPDCVEAVGKGSLTVQQKKIQHSLSNE
jgi:hypothetical protein